MSNKRLKTLQFPGINDTYTYADEAPDYSSSSTYAVGDFVIYNGALYKCTTAIATAEAWTAAHWTQTQMGTEVTTLKNALTENISILSLDGSIALDFSNYESGYIKYSDGTLNTSSTYVATDYIDVAEYSSITYKRINDTASSGNEGIAFYNASKTYLSGQIKKRSADSTGYETITIGVPSGAKYARFTMFVDTATYGDFTLTAESKFYSANDAIKNIGEKRKYIDNQKVGQKYWELFEPTEIEVRTPYNTSWEEDISRTFYSDGSIRITSTGSMMDIRCKTTSIDMTGVSKISCMLYIDDVTKITKIDIAVLGSNLTRTADISDLENGWNQLTIYPHEGTRSNWTTATGIRLLVYSDSGVTVWFDSVLFLRRPKALMIFIEDAGYTTFFENGQPDMDALNAPVTWAIDPYPLENGTANITLANVQSLFGNGNVEFSMHSYTASATADMTEAELRTDTLSAMTWLQKNGVLPQHPWRAAFTQNSATNYMAISNIVECMATSSSNDALNVFPWKDKYNIPRIALHGRTESEITDLFTTLSETHCTMVIYTHGISDGTYDTSTDLWDAFITALTTAINDGYVEPTTYNRLILSEDY